MIIIVSVAASLGLVASACSLIDDIIAQSCRKCIEFTTDNLTSTSELSAETLMYIRDYAEFGLL